ncbi:hypothetical protein [Demequina activiva]|uniref:Lipoprotein n=1 Tax=Demequina activiva TaxID=1582364 RepID=A0A919Q4Z3_9MICO|nr:hypothetical protein [Demequina activiva]GIG54378.1 hypothetical protein Dac01nite_11300 [Demequina activiva]
MRANLLTATLIAAALLVACSAPDPAPPSPSTTGSPTPGASADAPTGATSAASASPDATSDAQPDPIEAGIDPYCGPAQDGYVAMGELLDATDRKSAETGVEDDGGDVAAMNAAGEEILAASARVRAEWTQARALLESDGSPVTEGYSAQEAGEGFQHVLDHLDAWVDPEARIAAESSSIAQYDAGVLALLADERAIDAAASGGEGLSVVLGYTIERCGDLPAV